MPVETQTDIELLKGRSGSESELQNPAGDISGGVEQQIGNVSSFTIYLDVGGAVDITVELSPNGGSDYFEIAESPLVFNSTGQDAYHVQYNTASVRLTGSNTTDVQAIVREVV